MTHKLSDFLGVCIYIPFNYLRFSYIYLLQLYIVLKSSTESSNLCLMLFAVKRCLVKRAAWIEEGFTLWKKTGPV